METDTLLAIRPAVINLCDNRNEVHTSLNPFWNKLFQLSKLDLTLTHNKHIQESLSIGNFCKCYMGKLYAVTLLHKPFQCIIQSGISLLTLDVTLAFLQNFTILHTYIWIWFNFSSYGRKSQCPRKLTQWPYIPAFGHITQQITYFISGVTLIPHAFEQF